jgi:hypothetical protein
MRTFLFLSGGNEFRIDADYYEVAQWFASAKANPEVKVFKVWGSEDCISVSSEHVAAVYHSA